MTSRLLVLPDRTASSAENMATDLLLLECAAVPGVLWYRHYGWAEPAFTYGVSQSRERVRAIAGEGPVLVRRATGGGVVSHLNDWTYALVAPAEHPLAADKATASYRAVHAAIADALNSLGVPAELVPCPRESCGMSGGGGAGEGGAPVVSGAPRQPGVCFVQPEIYDVVRSDDGRKLAGAAQKRTRAGILFQGSVDKSACEEIEDWAMFDEALLARLAMIAEAEIESSEFPVFPEERRREALAMFASEAWNGKR
jgi:lipoate-protein ligase A